MSPGEEGTEQTTVKPKLFLMPRALPAPEGSEHELGGLLLGQAVMPLNLWISKAWMWVSRGQ